MGDREGLPDSALVRLRVALALAVAVFAGAGIRLALDDSAGSVRPLTDGVHSPKRAEPLSSPPRPTTDRATVVRSLTLAQLAGQRIVYAYNGPLPPASLLRRIRGAEAAGVILFAPNIGNRQQTQAVIAEIQHAARSSVVHAPLLIMTDQEGGLVRRLPGAPELSEMQIGESPNAGGLAAEAGRGAGLNLSGVGINVNLAPVLDVYRQPGDFIDSYMRSYSMNPTLVAALGGAFIAAQQQTGVAATAKHFPGLGAAGASQDTDEAPVRLDLPLHELQSVDERPYRTAIAAGVRLVMSSWAVYPALDPSFPAGLSPKVVEGELRGLLGFRGVTITDSIAAGALAPYGTFGQRGVLAARAGEDLLLCSAQNASENSPAEGADVLRALTAAIANMDLSRGDAEVAASRVLTLRLHP